jgi:tetratricopeptide (TPR) repeat protein
MTMQFNGKKKKRKHNNPQNLPAVNLRKIFLYVGTSNCYPCALIMNIHTTLEEAVRHHREGRLEQAEGLYRQILQTEPRNGNALNLLAVMQRQRGKIEDAIALARSAVSAQRRAAGAHFPSSASDMRSGLTVSGARSKKKCGAGRSGRFATGILLRLVLAAPAVFGRRAGQVEAGKNGGAVYLAA